MDLFIYPEAANNFDGYGIGVNFAYNKIPPKDDDIVVWLSSYERKDMLHVRNNDIILRRRNLFSIKSISKLLCNRNPSELTCSDLFFLRDYTFNEIHCDDVIFYKALRELFPNKKINLRLHNCFSRIGVRNSFLHRDIGLKYSYAIRMMKSVEKDIFNDRNVYKIFISNEDMEFYQSTYGIKSDSETWQYAPNTNLMKKNQKPLKLNHKLVWFGGIEAHKESSVKWFVNCVLPRIREFLPDVELHLWGKNTTNFNNPKSNVYGHGFYSGAGMPFNNSLYINPDIIGGGIKLKLLSMMEQGVPFISTPFGFEGYEKQLIDDQFCIVAEELEWSSKIVEILERYK